MEGSNHFGLTVCIRELRVGDEMAGHEGNVVEVVGVAGDRPARPGSHVIGGRRRDRASGSRRLALIVPSVALTFFAMSPR